MQLRIFDMDKSKPVDSDDLIRARDAACAEVGWDLLPLVTEVLEYGLAAVVPSIWQRGYNEGRGHGCDWHYREGGIDALRQAADGLDAEADLLDPGNPDHKPSILRKRASASWLRMQSLLAPEDRARADGREKP
jgi:hypothetical protein